MYLYGLSHLTSVRLTPVVIGLLVLIFTGLGWLFGKYRLKANTKQIVVRDNLIAAVFGLSALVLGFTFANATVSFNLRMSENVNAATALEEVFVSTKYLEPSDQLQMKKSLRELVDYRLVAHTAKSISTVGFSTIMDKTALLTRKMTESGLRGSIVHCTSRGVVGRDAFERRETKKSSPTGSHATLNYFVSDWGHLDGLQHGHKK